MTDNQHAHEMLLTRYLENRVAEVPTLRRDLWPRVSRMVESRDRSASEAHRPHRVRHPLKRTVVPLALCAIIALGGFGGALASSSSLRRVVTHVLSWSGSGSGTEGEYGGPTGTTGLYPVPAFRLFYPVRTPTRLSYYGVGQYRASSAGDVGGGSGAGINCPSPKRSDTCNAAARLTTRVLFPGYDFTGSRARTSIDLIARRGTAVVWFGFHALAPRTGEIQITEWNAHAYMPSREPALGITTATLPHEAVVFLVRHGTAIAVKTNLGAAELRGLVRALRPVKFKHTH